VKRGILVAATVLIAAPALSQRSHSGSRNSMPRGSFLQTPARTTAALLKEFDTNPEVSRRYMGIFDRSREETRLILSRLQPKALSDQHEFPVAFYSHAGQWLYRENPMSQGTVVFVTPEGKPFIKQECGNPLVARLPYPKEEGKLTSAPIPLPRSVDPRVVVVAPSPFTSVERLLEPDPDLRPATETVPSFALAEPSVTDIFTELTPESSPGLLEEPGFASSRDDLYWGLALLPLLVGNVAFDFGPHGGGNRDTLPIGGPTSGPNAIPEAPGWALMAVGALVPLAMLRRSKRRAERALG
jgi:hypothetical protein